MRKIGVRGVIEAGSDLSRNGDPSEMKILGFINFKKKNAELEFEQREKKCFAKLSLLSIATTQINKCLEFFLKFTN